MLNRAKARPADNLEPMEEELRRLTLASLQVGNRFADFHARAECVFDRIRSLGNRDELEYLCRELRNYATHFNRLQQWTEDLEKMLNGAASSRIKE